MTTQQIVDLGLNFLDHIALVIWRVLLLIGVYRINETLRHIKSAMERKPDGK